MKLDFLPERFIRSLEFLKFESLHELRLRAEKPSIIDYGGKKYLGECGVSQNDEDILIPKLKEIADIVFNACERSIYAHNDKLKAGYVTVNGIRIGICGRAVTEGEKITTLKEFCSLNIRFPHQVKNCSLNALPFLIDSDQIYSTLVVSPPGGGKTTFLRDLARLISQRGVANNVLIIDERDEICCMQQGVPYLDVGCCDVYSGVSKEWGIINGIRTLAPDVIMLDEIITKSDCAALEYAIGCGVSVIATVHSLGWNELFDKPLLKNVMNSQIFDRIVVLSKRNGVGTIEGVLNGDGKLLWEGK
ncbi:MAG: hypothetical protein IKQ31_00110 [Clostridia bacterium]|nr:hypothetical protein [Clostridia bacterium]